MNALAEDKGTGIFSKPQNIVLLLLVVVILAAAAVVVVTQYNPTVAVVNGEKIKRNELYTLMYIQGGRDAVDYLIETQLILQEGKKCGITVSGKELDEEVDSIITDYYGGDEEQFRSFLESQGYNLDFIRNDLRRNLMLKKIISTDLVISEKEAKEYLEENREHFDIPEEVKARHILVETKKEALEVISRLEKGEDFAELAKELSQDPGSKESGGDLGFFGRGRMAKEFEEAAFSLKDGERSGPVKTVHGYHIIERMEYKKGRAVTYEEVADEVEETIENEKLPLLAQELLSRLKDEAVVDYRD